MDRLAKTQAPKAETSLQTEVAKIVSDVVGTTAEGKKLAKNLTVEVKEYQFTSADKKAVNALVVYLPFVFVQNQRALIPKLVNEIQKKKNRHTFVLAKRTIVNPKAAYKQRIPRSRTLTAVEQARIQESRRLLAALAAELGVRFVDLSQALDSAAFDSASAIPTEHLDAGGRRQLAALLARELRGLRW